MRNVVLVMLTVLCAGCQRTAEPAAPVAAETPKAPVIARGIVPYAGRWRSSDDALASRRALVLDVSASGRFSIEVRRATSTHDEVMQSMTGQARISGGTLHGILDDRAKGTLLAFGRWEMRLVEGGAEIKATDRTLKLVRVKR